MSELAELEEQRAFLLRSIEDLDAEFEAGDIDEADYRSLRDDYTARAAAVIRRLEATDPTPRSERTPPPQRRSRLVWAAGVLVVALGAGWLVAAAAGERVDGQAATGSLPEASTDRIARAQRLVREGEVLEAIKVYDELLRDDPDNPVALAERGWLISRVDPSLVDRGLASIDKAIDVDPGYAEAYFYRGMILLQAKQDNAGAAAAFSKALESDPPPDLRSFLEDALTRVQEQQPSADG
ncbi:MAG TPA: tetratricopeptide repeat protein [Acidimicrobiales bacterium]|nr:tetratricopeptide repeat protein [Acidimicrobiales bacterium]